MKIEGPNKSTTSKGVSRTGTSKGAGGGSFSSLVDSAEAATSQEAVSGARTVGQLDALLALQEAGDGLSGGAKKARERAETLLEQLERIRMGILTGSIPQTVLQQLAQTLQTQREKVMDPYLSDVLDEIDLRVQVELAKLGG